MASFNSTPTYMQFQFRGPDVWCRHTCSFSNEIIYAHGHKDEFIALMNLMNTVDMEPTAGYARVDRCDGVFAISWVRNLTPGYDVVTINLHKKRAE